MSTSPPAGLPFHLLLPLFASVVYVAGVLLLKRASELGADVWRTSRICNLTSAIVFAPLALLGGTTPDLVRFWQPALVAMLFVLGQVFTLLSLRVGDVSVATPVLGLKTILVALLTTVLLGEELTASLWTAAALSSVALALLHLSQTHSHRRTGSTIFMAGIAASSYALFDVLVQKWSPSWGVGRLLPIMMGFVAIYSFVLQPIGGSPSGTIPAPALRWTAAGAACFALQGAMIVSAIAIFGQATVANVLYGSRGLWSVLAVWIVGHWFGNQERRQGPRVLGWRLVGSAFLMAALVIVLLDGGHGRPSVRGGVGPRPDLRGAK